MSGREQVLENVRRTNPVPRLDTMAESDLAELDSLLDQRRSLMTDLKNVSRPIDQLPQQTRRARRPAMAFVAALVLVLAAVGAVALVSTNDDPPRGPAATSLVPPTTSGVEPTQPSSPESSGITTPTTEPITSAPTFLDGQWKRVAVGGDMTINDLVSTDFGLFASAFDRGLVHSTDGVLWRPVELDMPLRANVLRVVEHAGGVNVYGIEESGTLLWRSEDGDTWTRTTVLAKALIPEGVAVTASSLLAYGWLESSGTHLLLSEDGTSHTSVGAEEAGLVGVSLQSVIPTSEGLFGLAMTEDGFSLYRSENGVSWESVPGSDFPLGASPGSIMQHDQSIYAVGAVESPVTPDGGPRLAIWRAAADGTWDQLEAPAPAGNSWLGSMIATEYGLLAVGGHETFDPHESGLIVLMTRDGLVFEHVPDPEDVFRDGGTQAPPVVSGDQIVILGGSDAWIWSLAT